MLQRIEWTALLQRGLLVCLFLGGGIGSAQPQEPSPTGSPWQPGAHFPPINLQVLPKDISENELHRVMKQFRDELGVTCGYCHAQNPQTQKLDFASDDNPTKQTARLMISMLSEINEKYLTRLGDRRYSVSVTCGSCHQGQSTPPGFEPK